MSDVFVSYAREDADRVRSVVRALQSARSWSVWWDRELHAGAEFDQVIERELKSARCVLVFWSEHSVRSAWVRDEAAIARNRRVMVPVALDGTQPPLGFRSIHCRSLSGSGSDEELQALIVDIGNVLAAPVPPPPPPPPPPRLKREYLFAAGAAVVASAALVGFFHRGSEPAPSLEPLASASVSAVIAAALNSPPPTTERTTAPVASSAIAVATLPSTRKAAQPLGTKTKTTPATSASTSTSVSDPELAHIDAAIQAKIKSQSNECQQILDVPDMHKLCMDKYQKEINELRESRRVLEANRNP